MWPFRGRKQPTVPSVRLTEVTTDQIDYPVFTVGQSRLDASFRALNFTSEDPPRFTVASLVPIIDLAMKKVADVEIRIDGHVVGYLRPPALDTTIAALRDHRAESLEVPVMLLSTPAGPEVRVHGCVSGSSP